MKLATLASSTVQPKRLPPLYVTINSVAAPVGWVAYYMRAEDSSIVALSIVMWATVEYDMQDLLANADDDDEDEDDDEDFSETARARLAVFLEDPNTSDEVRQRITEALNSPNSEDLEDVLYEFAPTPEQCEEQAIRKRNPFYDPNSAFDGGDDDDDEMTIQEQRAVVITLGGQLLDICDTSDQLLCVLSPLAPDHALIVKAILGEMAPAPVDDQSTS